MCERERMGEKEIMREMKENWGLGGGEGERRKKKRKRNPDR